MHTYIYVYMYMYMCTYLYIYIYIYKYNSSWNNSIEISEMNRTQHCMHMKDCIGVRCIVTCITHTRTCTHTHTHTRKHIRTYRIGCDNKLDHCMWYHHMCPAPKWHWTVSRQRTVGWCCGTSCPGLYTFTRSVARHEVDAPRQLYIQYLPDSKMGGTHAALWEHRAAPQFAQNCQVMSHAPKLLLDPEAVL